MIIDTRELHEKLEELEDRYEAYMAADDDEDDDWCVYEAEYEELCELRDNIPEWEDGETMISEDDFVEYVKEMLKDCGDLPNEIPRYIAIDWEETADNIRLNYGEINYDGDVYWYRDC